LLRTGVFGFGCRGGWFRNGLSGLFCPALLKWCWRFRLTLDKWLSARHQWRLLDDVGQLVGQQATARAAFGGVLAGTEGDVAAEGEGASVDRP
ncbi:MAG TPA: hypothetical protein VGC93_05655, partial [Thermoanaerobaculia bacterium]